MFKNLSGKPKPNRLDRVVTRGHITMYELKNVALRAVINRVTLVMASTGYFGDGPSMRERDFTEAISQRMRVPERLRVGPARHAHEPEDLAAAYSMHIPDRLALTDAPDMSPRPLFSKHTSSMWDLQHASWDREVFMREPVQIFSLTPKISLTYTVHCEGLIVTRPSVEPRRERPHTPDKHCAPSLPAVLDIQTRPRQSPRGVPLSRPICCPHRACYRPPGSWASRRPRNSCESTPPGLVTRKTIPLRLWRFNLIRAGQVPRRSSGSVLKRTQELLLS
ncbi:uncharacterized protein LOC143702275 isoform X2 [Siphateles boraxobius]|uniref:uncharacterized protein LOC143702275 isoform X2 n=1 Tax=Siphateles boraxobius TaxID=180520 RepID=UPI0040646127